MKSTLEDIRQRLGRNEYRNEEHVRLCLVARILLELGWNVWDPTQVDAECVSSPLEDNTRVDFALFARPQSQHPFVFIEVKRVGHAQERLDEVERQLRDYNRNHTAPFSIITDGQRWWFYYSQTAGEFRDKRFASVDLLDSGGSLEQAAEHLRRYLGKESVISGKAEEAAKSELRLSQRRKTFLECLQQARRLVQEPPYPALPAVVAQLMTELGHQVDENEATQLLKTLPSQPVAPIGTQAVPNPSSGAKAPMSSKVAAHSGAKEFPPNSPPDLRFTSMDRAALGSAACQNWNQLVEAGLRIASARNLELARVARVANINDSPNSRSDSGFHFVAGTGWSYQNKDAMGAWRAAYALAVELRESIEVQFHWRENEGSAHPNQSGAMRWSPQP